MGWVGKECGHFPSAFSGLVFVGAVACLCLMDMARSTSHGHVCVCVCV